MSTLNINKSTYNIYKYTAFLSITVIFLLSVAFLQPFSFTENTNATTETTQNGDYYIETTTTDLNLTINTTPAGAQETVSHDVTVKTDDPAGYTLTVSVNNDTSNALNLNGSTSATEKFNATSGTYDAPKALDENSWGFADTLTKKNNDQWAAVPLLSNAQQIKQTSSASTSGDTTTMYYAINAKYDGKHPNGNYSNTITYSVVGNTIPREYMHEKTYANWCQDKATFSTDDVEGTTYELYDKRNEMPYYIRKFSDGNCWMVENLNLPGGTTLDTTYSNASYTLPPSSTSFTTSTGTTPRMNNGEGRNRNGATYSGNAVDGAYYNWCTAVANQGGCYGTDKVVTSTATSNICPKGWRLPASNEQSTIATAISKLGINYFFTASGTSTADGGKGAPSSPVYSGSRYSSTLSSAGAYSRWWSSTQNSSSRSYYLNMSNGSPYTVSGDKFYGYSVRCLLSSTTTP